MKRQKIGYKVVHKSIGLYSETYWSVSFHKEIEYFIGKPTTRPFCGKRICGPLAVFKTLKDAKGFVASFGAVGPTPDRTIFKCKYRPSDETFLFRYVVNIMVSRVTLPTGTDLADEVTLIEEVKW